MILPVVSLIPCLIGGTETSSSSLSLEVVSRSVLLDYGLPGHPRDIGVTQLGTTAQAQVVWRAASLNLEVGAGVLARLPFTLEFESELDAAPQFFAQVTPLPGTRIRLGTLDPVHGHHPAVFDEVRAQYGRDISQAYQRALAADVHRELPGDPWLGSQQGAQLLGDWSPLHFDLYVDWQLLESPEHRERFAFGALLGLETEYVNASAEMRLNHVGGQIFTKSDPVRFAGLDPVRQPTTGALTVMLKPVSGWMSVRLGASLLGSRGVWVGGVQTPSRHGVEPKLELHFFETSERHLPRVELAWSWWVPQQPGTFGDEGDPIYSADESHRVRVGTTSDLGIVRLRGRVDAIFPTDSNEVQYEAVTELEARWDVLLWGQQGDRNPEPPDPTPF